jgi:hypothetical protein
MTNLNPTVKLGFKRNTLRGFMKHEHLPLTPPLKMRSEPGRPIVIYAHGFAH